MRAEEKLKEIVDLILDFEKLTTLNGFFDGFIRWKDYSFLYGILESIKDLDFNRVLDVGCGSGDFLSILV